MNEDDVLMENRKLRTRIDTDKELLIYDDETDRVYVRDLLDYPFTSIQDAREAFSDYIRPDKIDEFLQALLYVDDSEIPLESPFTMRATKITKDVVEKAEESQMMQFQDFEDDSSSGEESDERVFDGDVIISDQDLWIKNRKILENATFTIVRGRIYGLVGKNGIGKSTLLRAIRKRRFGISKGLHMYLVKQEDKLTAQRVLDYVLDGCFDDSDQILRAKKILREVGFDEQGDYDMINEDKGFEGRVHLNDSKDHKSVVRPQTLLNKTESNGILEEAPDVICDAEPVSDHSRNVKCNTERLTNTESKNTVLSPNGFSTNRKGRGKPQLQAQSDNIISKIRIDEYISSLSGGWRVRASLAKAFLKAPQLLLLDEPTNMLDFPTIVWLEKAVKALNTTIIIVSHDREFLNNVCTDILHLNDLKITAYKGNYDSFVHHRTLALENQQKEYVKQQEYRRHLQDFIDRFRYNSKRASLAQSKIKILENMVLIEPVKKEVQIRFKFKSSPAKGVLIELKSATIGYITNNNDKKRILNNIDFRIAHSSRVVIVGPNGAGKSTLLRLLSKKLEVFSGIAVYNPNIRPAYFTQHHIDQLDPNQTVLEFFHKASKLKDDEMRKTMACFNLLADAQKIGTLSGGQKSRLAFSILSASEPNLLIFDEPTNHLDMESIDALATCLSDFEGAVIAVSHDLRFIEKVFSEVWVCDGGSLKFFNGSIRDYKNTLCGQ